MIELKYAGFWIRTLAAIVDSILIMIIINPILALFYGPGYWQGESLSYGGWDTFLQFVFPALACILFWIYKSATPGKMITKIKIVDAETGAKPSIGQSIGRYAGYFVAMIPLFLGILWVGFDKRKQGWHDKLAGTVVISIKSAGSVDEENITPSKM